jgi:hypothetical protein
MARIEVEGTVASVNGTGSGFRIEESWEGRDGRRSRRYWTAWFPRASSTAIPNKGDVVKANGFLSTKVSEKDARYVDHTIQEVRVEFVARASAYEVPPLADDYLPVDDYPPTDAWAVAPIPNDEDTPF